MQEFGDGCRICSNATDFKPTAIAQASRAWGGLREEFVFAGTDRCDMGTAGFGARGVPSPSLNGMEPNPSGSFWKMTEQGQRPWHSDREGEQSGHPKTGQTFHPENQILNIKHPNPCSPLSSSAFTHAQSKTHQSSRFNLVCVSIHQGECRF